MGIQENKKAVIDVIDTLQAADIEGFKALTTDDFTWWIAPTSINSGMRNKEEWVALMHQFFDDAAGPFLLKLFDVTAEEDRVSVTAKGHFERKNGSIYHSDYHFLFFVRDGKVSAVKDYTDTYHTGLVFGFPET